MKHLALHRRLAHLLALVLALGCQARGRVHEAPPASYPDPDPTASPEAVAPLPSNEPVPSADAYALPPGPSSPSAPELEAPPAPSEGWTGNERGAPSGSGGWDDAKAETSPSIGRSRATTKAPARSLDAQRSGPLARRPAPERPGLATHWGETRYSPARQVEFERSQGDRPSAVIELHYNDRGGARRMLPRGDWGRAEAWLLGGLRVSVVDAAGRTMPALRSGSRVVGVGAPGERYSLAIENSTGGRFEVVASVDGLDVLDGETASFEKRGYLVAPYSSVLIDGFRRSDAEVAAFRLGDVARSYAASKGKARNVGVLGFALFEERRPIVVEPPRWRERSWDDDTRQRRDADAFPGQYARPPVW